MNRREALKAIGVSSIVGPIAKASDTNNEEIKLGQIYYLGRNELYKVHSFVIPIRYTKEGFWKNYSKQQLNGRWVCVLVSKDSDLYPTILTQTTTLVSTIALKESIPVDTTFISCVEHLNKTFHTYY